MWLLITRMGKPTAQVQLSRPPAQEFAWVTTSASQPNDYPIFAVPYRPPAPHIAPQLSILMLAPARALPIPRLQQRP